MGKYLSLLLVGLLASCGADRRPSDASTIFIDEGLSATEDQIEQNEDLIEDFFRAFKALDSKKIGRFYADKAIFTDGMFVDLNAKEVRAMWSMLSEGLSKSDLWKLKINKVVVEADKAIVDWVVTYKYSKKTNKVVNPVTSTFYISNGLIVKQQDKYDLSNWIYQTFGPFKWAVMNNKHGHGKLRKAARKKLDEYMKSKEK